MWKALPWNVIETCSVHQDSQLELVELRHAKHQFDETSDSLYCVQEKFVRPQ